MTSRERLAAVLHSVAEDSASSDPGRLLNEAVAGGLLITEGGMARAGGPAWCRQRPVGSVAGNPASGRPQLLRRGSGHVPARGRQRAGRAGRPGRRRGTHPPHFPAQQAAREGAAAKLRAATEARALLARARAAIAAIGDVTDTEAFTRLARQSGHDGRSILAVARDVLASSGRLAGQEPPS
jgi:hypothetical protein